MDLERLTQAGWTLVHGEPFCWINSKEIMIYPDTLDYLFLHEVAHALYPFPETLGKGKHFHGSQHAATFGKLVDKYMETRKRLKYLIPVMPPEKADPDAEQGSPFKGEPRKGEGEGQAPFQSGGPRWRRGGNVALDFERELEWLEEVKSGKHRLPGA